MVEPVWGRKLVTEITTTDVDKILTRIAEGRARDRTRKKPNNRARSCRAPSPRGARQPIGEVLRKMFTLAVQWGWCEDNPAQRFYRRTETPRERFLSKEEIGKLAAALDAAEDRRAADIIRMCMLTGARLGEVRQARFEQFNLEHMSWSKPPTMTKQRRAHRVPISDETAAIVRQRLLLVPKRSPWLFPGDTPGPAGAGGAAVLGAGPEAVRAAGRPHRTTCANLCVLAGQRRGFAGNDREAPWPQPDADHAALCPPDGLAPTRRGRRCGQRLPTEASAGP